MVSRPLRGRARELASITAAMDGARRGQGATLLVEGGPGMGKSRLLDEARALAVERGFRVATGRAAQHPGEPFEPLLAAFFQGIEPLLSREQLRALGSEPLQPYWFVQELQALLELAVQAGPLLIIVDDMQWADPGTLLALRTMPRGLAGLPVIWLLASRTREVSAELRATTTLLRRDGAVTLQLETLDGMAVREVVADALGGEGDSKLLRLAERGQGSPFMLNELLEGLIEEDLVHVVSGRAELTADRLPDRLGKSMTERLEDLSPEARQVLRVAAILGSRFSFELLTAMLERPATAIIGPLEEAMAADLLTEADDRLAFRHDLLHEAVLATLPEPLRRGLHAQAATVLRELDAGPVAVAHHLAVSAEVGDAAAIAALQEAVGVLRTSDVGAAADLSLRALRLTAHDDPERAATLSQTVALLYTALRFTEGDDVAGEVLDGMVGGEDEADLLLSHITTHVQWSRSARTEADVLRVMGLPGLSAPVRARHLSGLALNLPVAGRFREAWEVAPSALEAARESGDPTALGFATLGMAILEHARGRYAAALALHDAAHGHFLRVEAAQTRVVGVTSVQAVRARVLADFGRLDDALALYEEGMASAQRDRDDWSLWVWLSYGSQMLLEAGRIGDARAHVEAAEMTSGLVDSAMEPLAVFTRVTVALHTGDQASLADLERRAQSHSRGRQPDPPALGRLDAGRRRKPARGARRGRSVARGRRAALRGGDPVGIGEPRTRRWSCVPRSPVNGRSSPPPRSSRLSSTSARTRTSRSWPRRPRTLVACYNDDPSEILRAVQLLRTAGRPLMLAAALEDAHAAALRSGQHELGVALLREALVTWSAAGARPRSSESRGS